MIGVQAVIVHLLLLVIKRVSVDSARILLLLAVSEILHGLGSSEILVAITVSLKLLGVIFEGLCEPASDLFINGHFVHGSIGIVIVVLLRTSHLDDLNDDHSEGEDQSLNHHHVELAAPFVLREAIHIDQDNWSQDEDQVQGSKNVEEVADTIRFLEGDLILAEEGCVEELVHLKREEGTEKE